MKYGRLLVLAVALGAGLLAARLVLSSNQPSPEPVTAARENSMSQAKVLVATRDVGLGEKLSSSDLTWADWPESAIPNGAMVQSAQSDALETVTGQIARAPIYDGEPIREQRLVSTDKGYMAAILPKGKRAIAVSVGAETTAGGFILPGDRVDLILTRSDNSSSAISETFMENVRVLAIDETTAGERDEKSLSPQRTATLELSIEQAEIVAQSQQVGKISLALRSAQDSEDDGEGAVTSHGGVNFVKYGVSSQVGTR
ncbi:MAG: Flp pilus assembly protein CpaB [Rhodobacteraceae bacterium]|nr:Flp pilus assembly protein CpaB [Paracoccaceae bacterium]